MRPSLIAVLIAVMFATPVAGAEVYYCSGVNDAEIKGGKLTQYKPQNFKMQVAETQIKMADDGWFEGSVFKVEQWATPSNWLASSYDPMTASHSYINFYESNFHYVFVNAAGIVAIVARCTRI